MSKETGGSAFPRPFSQKGNFSDSGHYPKQDGMTLRDFFAAKAMGEIDWKLKPLDQSASDCYAVADAMLVARNS
jgi:hypothetical protein